MKKSAPKLVRLSDEAVNTLPESLKNALPAGHMAYAIQPEDNGVILISDAPSAAGHICAFVQADQVEMLPKVKERTANKASGCCISVSFEPDADGNEEHGLLNMAVVPEGLTDEELTEIIKHTGQLTGNLNELVEMLANYGPAPVEIVTPDIVVTVSK